jgi:hypothetical protein
MSDDETTFEGAEDDTTEDESEDTPAFMYGFHRILRPHFWDVSSRVLYSVLTQCPIEICHLIREYARYVDAYYLLDDHRLQFYNPTATTTVNDFVYLSARLRDPRYEWIEVGPRILVPNTSKDSLFVSSYGSCCYYNGKERLLLKSVAFTFETCYSVLKSIYLCDSSTAEPNVHSISLTDIFEIEDEQSYKGSCVLQRRLLELRYPSIVTCIPHLTSRDEWSAAHARLCKHFEGMIRYRISDAILRCCCAPPLHDPSTDLSDTWKNFVGNRVFVVALYDPWFTRFPPAWFYFSERELFLPQRDTIDALNHLLSSAVTPDSQVAKS